MVTAILQLLLLFVYDTLQQLYYVQSGNDPKSCVQFIKSSIKRKYSDVNDDIKKIVKCMGEDKDSNVQFKITDNNKVTTELWPSYLAGVYILDRIEDVATNRDCNREAIFPVIAVYARTFYKLQAPNYFADNKEILTDFIIGLNVSINRFSIIAERDAIAVNYGNYHLREFTDTPTIVMFVGVDFYEAHAFLVSYTIVHFVYTNYDRVGMRSWLISTPIK